MDKDVISRLREFKYQGKQNLKYLRELNLDALKQRHLKKLTILHSNDLHGDFLAEEVDSGLVGGVSMLSGYISKVRNEEKNVIYVTTERYYYNYMEESLNIPLDEIEKNGPPVQLAMSAANVLEEYMMSQEFIKLDGEPRLIIHTDNCQNS